MNLQTAAGYRQKRLTSLGDYVVNGAVYQLRVAEERWLTMAAGLLAVAAFMTAVTPYSVGEAYAVGANWLGARAEHHQDDYRSGRLRIVSPSWIHVAIVIRLPDSVPQVGITLSALIPGFLDPLHFRHYRGPGELWQQLPPDHHRLIDVAGGDGRRRGLASLR